MRLMYQALLPLLLLLAAVCRGQDEGSGDAAAPAPPAAAGAADDGPDPAKKDGASGAAAKAGGNATEDCEESWDYIAFLRGEVNGKVDEILGDLRDAKNQKGVAVLGDTISNTMKKILEVREAVLQRIFKVRKAEVKICPDQNIRQEEMLNTIRMEIMSILLKLIDRDAATVEKLNEIKDDLLKFRMNVNNEVMRVMMLPQGKGQAVADPESCQECDLLDGISKKIENLIACAEKDEEGDGPIQARAGAAGAAPATTTPAAPAAGGAADGSGDGAAPGENCMPPAMYFMELMTCNSKIDEETERLFPALFSTFDEEERLKLEEKLTQLKAVREQIEDVITKLSKTKEEDKLKKVVSRSLTPVFNDLEEQLKECKANCGTGGCDSCAATILNDMLDKMKFYLEIYNATEEDQASEKNEEVRRDLMKLISENSDDGTAILGKKIEGDLEKCDEDKMDIYNRTKNPLWMLVNTTIFAEGVEEPKVMVETMIEMLTNLLQEYCTDDDAPKRPTSEGPSCEWEEYEQIGEYINKIDEIIQDALFKPKEDSAKKTAQLGFVEIKKMLDKRVEKLFLDNMVCPEEAITIKKEWMSELNRCMAVFMNSKLKFTQMTRVERLSCTKELRGKMEDRRSGLLQKELEKTLKGIGTEGSGEGVPA